ncbi:hypothetical protein A3K80_08975 [Candidatus Bathyarchaeota archaeon RBG_13_38_9]|nr:MAG: hypothetical protein A3K80_08975 [Candidatus Bathyarchaeota archaeon RBG_13_38_9]
MLAISLALSAVTPALAVNIDQSNDVTRGPVANTSDWGQSFTPTMKYLWRVDLALDSDLSNSKTYDITINIRETWNGPNLGSATTSVPPGRSSANIGEFVAFIFDPPLRLNPGSLYIIHIPLSQYWHQGGTYDRFDWHAAEDDDTYPRGQAYAGGNPQSYDMVFRTFGSDQTPYAVGGVISPTNKLEILTPYIALAGLVITVSAIIVVKRRRD